MHGSRACTAPAPMTQTPCMYCSQACTAPAPALKRVFAPARIPVLVSILGRFIAAAKWRPFYLDPTLLEQHASRWRVYHALSKVCRPPTSFHLPHKFAGSQSHAHSLALLPTHGYSSPMKPHTFVCAVALTPQQLPCKGGPLCGPHLPMFPHSTLPTLVPMCSASQPRLAWWAYRLSCNSSCSTCRSSTYSACA